jgi:hypothetical protein
MKRGNSSGSLSVPDSQKSNRYCHRGVNFINNKVVAKAVDIRSLATAERGC